jgi:hypothetical protein
MKMKYVVTALLSVITLNVSAQFTFRTLAGDPINEGDIYTYNSVANDNAKLRFRIQNTITSPIEVKIQAISITGGNGTGFELCYAGTCNDNIALNGIYPDYEYPLGPGQNNGNFDHFVNNNALGGMPADFVFSVYAVGFESQAITFTYRYAPDMSVSTITKAAPSLILEQTQVQHQLSFSAEESGTASIINLNGQAVTGSFSFEAGLNQQPITTLSSGVYFIKASYSNGATEVVKFIKK